MRGKGRFLPVACLSIGITPAYAGKSCQRSRRFPAYRDHPRLCGEKFFRRIRPAQLPGSPPPMRGKGKDYQLGDKVSRITPAYAGKSTFWNPIVAVYVGSPPPMRGKARLSGTCRTRARITPAYAGKS